MAVTYKLNSLPSSRRKLGPTKEDVQENAPHELRKRLKSSALSNLVNAGSISDESFNLPVDTKCNSEAQEGYGSSLNSKLSPFSSSEPKLPSQGGQPKNDEKSCKRDEVIATVGYQDEESDSSEDDDGISIEELQKTPGWLLFVKNVERHFEREDFGNQ
ncbi:hypothetical protein AWC38_SpisGene19824 [Stylophora pistillata]|uniref:Uncharacterized protein n=1 Tax=Stylophora pistillata TaxID=50429 RepID=A0A2B4RHV3_STYPI|nr:hypothetical protein AWC38_SpisGene19824 [Stylophora pistillata]